jgi:hypothetical protein
MGEETISNLIAKLERGDIQIPELQRQFVWKPSQVELLIDSIYRECPIGMLTFYIPPPELGGREGIYWVLDGQQRLLSLQIITKGSVTLEGGEKLSWVVCFDPKTEEFICKDYKPLGKWIIVPELYKIPNRRELERFLSSWEGTPEERERIAVLWHNLHEYKIPYREIGPQVDLQTLAEIFVRTNYAGTPVRGTDIFSTMIAVAESGSAKELRDFVRKLPGKWNEIQYGTIIKTFVAFLTNGKVKLASRVFDQAKKLKDELTLNKHKIRDIINITKESFKRAIDLLEQGWLKITSPDHELLPYENLLVTLSFYLGKRGNVTEIEERNLLTWYILASYFKRYGISSESRLNEDLSLIAEGKGWKELIKKIEEREGNLRNRIHEDIERGYYHSGSKLLLYALLRMNQAKDMLSRLPLDSRDVSLHHIFPIRALGEDAQNLNNLTLTTLRTNNDLLDSRPQDYLPRVPSEIRKQHMIPEDPTLWELEKYKEFCEARKTLLKEVVNKMLEEIKN